MLCRKAARNRSAPQVPSLHYYSFTRARTGGQSWQILPCTSVWCTLYSSLSVSVIRQLRYDHGQSWSRAAYNMFFGARGVNSAKFQFPGWYYPGSLPWHNQEVMLLKWYFSFFPPVPFAAQCSLLLSCIKIYCCKVWFSYCTNVFIFYKCIFIKFMFFFLYTS